MKQFLVVAKALSDETRVRALLSLSGGELCLCQIIDLLGMAPSTVSKHMDLLYQAGLVERRKEGKWQYFSLCGRKATSMARRALAWVLDSVESDVMVAEDARKLSRIRKKQLKEVSKCYREK